MGMFSSIAVEGLTGRLIEMIDQARQAGVDSDTIIRDVEQELREIHESAKAGYE